MHPKEIKGKIEVTQGLSKITRALELVSAVKMKRAQRFALNSRPFTQVVLEILTNLEDHPQEIKKSIYFQKRSVDKTLAVVISSDKGFCAAFNKNILGFARRSIERLKNVEIFAIGKKAGKFFKKAGYRVLVEFSGIGDYGRVEDTRAIADKILDYFQKGRFQEIFLYYTDFVSSFTQKPREVRLLPLDMKVIKETLKHYQLKNAARPESPFPLGRRYYTLLEPSPMEIFEALVPRLIAYLIHHSILEANASEHSARMMAMRRANENAEDILRRLTLEYNKARQAQITAEVCEIGTAKEATA